VRAAGRTILTEFESKALLAAYGLPVVETVIAASEDEAVAAADKMGYPVVTKIYSETITHKTDVGGVQLNLKNAEAVRKAFNLIKDSVTEKVGAEHFLGVTVQPMIKLEGYELILGSSMDSQFGPVLLFGQGGQLVEVMKDRALGLPPLTTTLARHMMQETKIYKALKGVRGRAPVDLPALEQLMVRFSQLVTEQLWIKEADLNPILASPDQLVALDARVLLHDLSTPEDQLPRPAIRPYPAQYETKWQLKDGTPVLIRPIRPEDEPLIVSFHQSLSERSVQSRYFTNMDFKQRTAHERLTRICFNDYDRELALVATREVTDPTGEHEHEIMGVARMRKLGTPDQADFMMLISDKWQGHGMGTKLLSLLLEVAKQENITHVHATMLPTSKDLQSICEKLGFMLTPVENGTRIAAVYEIK
jgi:acetyltransferase